MTRWNDIEDSKQQAIIEQYRQTPTQKLLRWWEEVTGIPAATLQRRAQEHLQSERSDGYFPHTQPFISVKPPSPLTDISWIDPLTDQGRFIDVLYEVQQQDRYARLMHACDFHFPYQHDGAAEIYYQLVKEFQPHLMAVGSDAADFQMISAFPKDIDEETGIDALDEFEEHFENHIDRILEASPETTLFFLLGNHEKRIYDFTLNKAPQLRRTIWRRFVEIARSKGRVYWLGETDYARIGPFILQHGNRVGLNPAKGMLEDIGYQCSTMGGHVHRLTRYERRGEDYPIIGVTSGCHCLYPPHFAKRKRMTSKWQLGTALAEVDLQGREVRIDNLEYNVEPDYLSVRYNHKIFYAENKRPSGFVSYEEYKRGL